MDDVVKISEHNLVAVENKWSQVPNILLHISVGPVL